MALEFGNRLSDVFQGNDAKRLERILGRLDLSQLPGFSGTFGRPDLQRLLRNADIFGGAIGGGGRNFLQGLLDRAQGPQGTPGGGGGVIAADRVIGGRILNNQALTNDDINRLRGMVTGGAFNQYMGGAQPFGVPDLLRALRQGQFGADQGFLEDIAQRLGLNYQTNPQNPRNPRNPRNPQDPRNPRNPRDPRNPRPDPDNPAGKGPNPGDGSGLPFDFGELTLHASPETGQINDLFDTILQRQEFQGLPTSIEDRLSEQLLGYLDTDAGSLTGGVGGDLRNNVEATINQLLGGEGIPEDVLERVKNRIRGDAAARERNLLRRRSEGFAGRGLFGGGQQVRELGNIERDISDSLAGSLANVDFQDALAAERARQAGVSGGLQLQNIGTQREALADQIRRGGVSGLLGLGQQNLQELGLGSNELMGALRAAIGREGLLTGRELELMDLEMRRSLQQLLTNLQIKATEFGIDPEQHGGVDITDILGDIFGNGGGGFGMDDLFGDRGNPFPF